MKKTLLALVGACCLLAACKDDKKSEIIVGTSADYKPFMFYENGEITGFEKELFDEIAKRMKRTPVYKDMSFDGLIGGLQAKRLDMVIANVAKTEERSKNVDFSNPYYSSEIVLLTHKNNAVVSIDDLKGKTVGVQMGTTYEQRAKDLESAGASGKVTSLSKIPELIQEWKIGRVEVIMLCASEASGIQATQPDLKIVNLEALKESFSIALPKNSADTAEINTILAELEKDGTLKALRAKWVL